MEKLRLPKKPVIKNEKDYGIPIRIRSSTHNLLDIVSNETGWSKVDVITKMVEFAFDNIEWVHRPKNITKITEGMSNGNKGFI